MQAGMYPQHSHLQLLQMILDETQTDYGAPQKPKKVPAA
jgi:hypothetical protein